MAHHGLRLLHHPLSPGLNTVGFLGLRILNLLRGRVEVLGAVGLAALLARWTAVILEILVVDGEGLIDLLAESLIVTGAVEC